MSENQEQAHAEHLRQVQDHFRWRQEHLEALATLRKAEAAILDHEARILAHDAEIARHEEAIAHGGAHADVPPAGEHGDFAHAHNDGAGGHTGLIEAIRALLPHLEQAAGK